MSNLSALEHKLVARLAGRAGDLLDDLRRHVNLPTGPGGTGLDECRALFMDRLRALGAKVEMIPGDARPAWLGPGIDATRTPATAVCARAGHGTRLLLAGHLDTVHEAASSFRTLTLASDGKTASGPGCMDMKGGIVIAIAALEALEEAGVACDWTFVLNADEETGSYASDRALRAAARGRDVGLAFEPAMSDGGLVVERPGSGQFMLETRGRAAHVGRDFASGVSAVNALVERLAAIARMPRPEEGLIVSVGPIEGGHATNIVPERARAWGNARFKDASQRAALELALRALGTAPEAMPSATIEFGSNRPPKPLTPATERLALLARQAAEDLGQRLPFGKTGGVCDGNNLQDEGLPTIDTLGVRGGGAHTAQEWVEVASLVERAQLAAVVMGRLVGRKWSSDEVTE